MEVFECAILFGGEQRYRLAGFSIDLTRLMEENLWQTKQSKANVCQMAAIWHKLSKSIKFFPTTDFVQNKARIDKQWKPTNR